MEKAWIPVLAGGLVETMWSCTMKMSNGLTDIPYTIVTLVLLVISTLLLNQGLKAGLQMGVCYAVWVGIGAAGSIVAGILVFGDSFDLVGAVLLIILLGAIVAMNALPSEEEKNGKDGAAE